MNWIKREKRPPMGGVFYVASHKGHEFKVSESDGGWLVEMDGKLTGQYYGWIDACRSAEGVIEMLLDPKYGWVNE